MPKLLGFLIPLALWLAFYCSRADASLTFRWFGVSGFVLTDGTTTLLFDPAVTSTPLSSWLLPFQGVRSDESEFDYWAERCGIRKLDAVFVNHTHTDHAIDAPTAVRKFGGLLAGSSSLKQLALGHRIPESSIRVLEDRQALDVGSFRVQAIETPHAPHFAGVMLADGEITSPLKPGSSPWEYRVGTMHSYWITHPEGKILFQAPGRVHSPDALAELKPDTLLLTIANRVSSEDLVQRRVIPSGARLVIPMHWDNFFRPLARSGAPEVLWFQNPGEFDRTFRRLASHGQASPRQASPRQASNVRLEWPEYCRSFEVGRSPVR